MQLTKWLHEPTLISKVKVQGHSDSTFSNFFFLETAWLIEAKFYVEPQWDGGTKVWSNGLGHMIKMAAMGIYGKNLKKSSSLEPKGWWPWKLVCSIGYSSSTKFVQMMTLGWPWPILRQGQIWSPMLFGKKVKQCFFSETTVVCDIKSEMRSFKSNENIHKKEGGSYYVVSANKASSVTL